MERPLVVFIVFFGKLPVWLPLTLQSMAANPRVDFVVVGDAVAPAILPPNVHFEGVSFSALQARLSALITPGNLSSVRYDDSFAGHYAKGNDVKPLAAEMYPEHVAGHDWWAWSDLDVVFGDLLKWMERATSREHAACCRCIPREKDGGRGAHVARKQCASAAPSRGAAHTEALGGCCKIPLRHSRRNGELEVRSVNMVNVYSHKGFCPCDHGEEVNVVTPLYPNPWRKKAWGPFTAFRTGWGTSLFRRSAQWQSVVASGEYAHFDEWWGEFHYSRGWETMGDVITRLAELDDAGVLPPHRPATPPPLRPEPRPSEPRPSQQVARCSPSSRCPLRRRRRAPTTLRAAPSAPAGRCDFCCAVRLLLSTSKR